MRASDLSRATWRKSSYSNGMGGSCVEIAMLTVAPGEHDIAVRDSKDPHGPALTFTARQWSAFTTAIKSDEFCLSPVGSKEGEHADRRAFRQVRWMGNRK